MKRSISSQLGSTVALLETCIVSLGSQGKCTMKRLHKQIACLTFRIIVIFYSAKYLISRLPNCVGPVSLVHGLGAIVTFWSAL